MDKQNDYNKVISMVLKEGSLFIVPDGHLFNFNVKSFLPYLMPSFPF